MQFIKTLDEFTFYTTLQDNQGVALVFFSGPHCASCHHLKNVINTEYLQFTKQLRHFSAYEVRADESSALVNEFEVFHLPSMFLYKQGNFHCELQAEAIPNQLIDAIKRALTKPAQEEP